MSPSRILPCNQHPSPSKNTQTLESLLIFPSPESLLFVALGRLSTSSSASASVSLVFVGIVGPIDRLLFTFSSSLNRLISPTAKLLLDPVPPADTLGGFNPPPVAVVVFPIARPLPPASATAFGVMLFEYRKPGRPFHFGSVRFQKLSLFSSRASASDALIMLKLGVGGRLGPPPSLSLLLFWRSPPPRMLLVGLVGLLLRVAGLPT